jgi:hypothetical protein
MIQLNGCQKCENRTHKLFGRCRYYDQILNNLSRIDQTLCTISPISNLTTTTDEYTWINRIEFECKYFKKIAVATIEKDTT